MLYNYQEFFVYMLLLPVVLNILLPLAMLVVWFVKYMVVGREKLPQAEADIGSGFEPGLSNSS